MPDAVSHELDVEFLGVADAICAHVVGDVLIDPGPESTAATLLAKLAEPPRAILLTHIHFDHAGATGALIERWPQTEVWVHERGAPHMVDPERLVNSARRLYGDDFDRLWGRVVPIPHDNIRVLSGGERIGPWAVQYTPGHASHHVCYLDTRTGAAFCGDTAGARIGPDGPLFPPTPPPDIDVELWARSLDVIAEWSPTALAITHFGAYTDVSEQLNGMREGLAHWAERARVLDGDAYAAEIAATWEGTSRAAAYDAVTPRETLWPGLHRYWSKRVPSDQ